jgi:2-polyprenyl-3-methyl-5-hydroxy-6-metoxy-1,4-benzoquinol methylase
VTLDDPVFVREEYATEAGLLGRRAAYRWADGPDALQVLFETIAALEPVTVFEVGCGPGELSQRIGAELNAPVVALDISPRMVELAHARGSTRGSAMSRSCDSRTSPSTARSRPIATG